MKAIELFNERNDIDEHGFVEIVVWRLSTPGQDRPHGFKYRLAYVRHGVCVLRYDNETGKGDHKHVGDIEEPYQFVSLDRLIADFLNDVRTWRD